MMKETQILQRIEVVTSLKMAALNLFIERVVSPIADIGGPQELVKKDYWELTPQELEHLILIYGTEPNALSRWIFKHEYAKLKELEREVSYGKLPT